MDLVKTNTIVGKKIGYFNKYILNRIIHNKNFICCITGQTGSGKSFSALKEGEILDPEFDITNVCFTPEEFMDLVNGVTKKLHRGSVIMYDEVQVTLAALDYQSLQSKLINSCLQTFRYMGFILIMTSPYFDFVNKSARKLFHSRWETVSINHKKGICTLKPFLLQTNQESGQIYRKYLRVHTKETGLIPCTRLKLNLPSQSLIDAYEIKRQKFSKELNDNIAQDLKRLKEGSMPKPLTEMQTNVVQCLINKKTVPQVATELNVEEHTVYFHIQQIERKGITITPVKEQQRVLYYDVKGFDETVL